METHLIERYSSSNVTDFHQRKTALQRFFSLGYVMQRIFIRHWLGENLLEAERWQIRQALMRRLASKDGEELYERIALAYHAEQKAESEPEGIA